MKKKPTSMLLFSLALLGASLPARQMQAQTQVAVEVTQQHQQRIVTGTVTDSEGHSLPGASVSIKALNKGVITDIDGNFKIALPSGKDVVLVFSYIGMESKEVLVKAKVKQALQVSLKENTQTMNEVVITGMANLRKESFTGNTTQIRRDELMKVNKTNVIQALQAFDPSFRIAENNMWGSDPNALPEVSIRGNSSLSTVKELDVTDKAQLKDNPNLPTFIMDGFEISVTKLYDMDPSRIESVTILKDAAATAMYGSRAANGVVVITTVVPKPGKLNVSYSYTGEIEMPDLSDYNLMNAAEKLETERLAGIFTLDSENNTETSYDTAMELEQMYNDKLYNVRRGIDTYWMSKPLRTSYNDQHSLYIDGGTEKVRFGAEMSYRQDNGVMKGSLRDNWTAGAYIDYRIGRFQVRNHMTYTVNRSQESPYGTFSDYTKQLPYNEFVDKSGNYLEELENWGNTGNAPNPLYEAGLRSFDKSSYEQFVNNLSIQWNINDYLLFKSNLGITRQFDSSERFLDPKSKKNTNILGSPQGGLTNVVSGELNTTSGDSFSVDWQASLAYNRYINEHNINASVNLNIQESKNTSLSAQYRGFPSGTLNSPNYAQEIVTKPTSSDDHSRLVGVTGLINYSYKDIYLFDLSCRLDGSSKFGSDNKFAPFWSTGVGLNIHNYGFMQDWRVIDLLKIRGSYGQTGTVNFASYDARTTYEVLYSDWYKTGFGASLKALGNPNLSWQTTNTVDVGLEVQFLKRYYLKASYYVKNTVDLINDVTIPSHSGFTTYIDNVGEVENKGFELSVRADVVQTHDWYVALFANLAHNRNKILKVADSLKDYNNKVDEFLNDRDQQFAREGAASKPLVKYIEGGSENSIWAVRSLGIDPATGHELFLTADNKVTNVWNSSDQVVVGTTEPDAQGSFGFNARWKNFSLYATFMYEWGGQRYNQTLVDKIETVNLKTDNADRRVLTDRWKQPGDVSRYKKLWFGENMMSSRATSRFVQDYNWMSLNSLTLGYDFNSNLIAPWHLSMLRFEVGANELFRVSSVEQERGLSYPYSRTINFSIKASF